jgi:Heparinase II/III-like protein
VEHADSTSNMVAQALVYQVKGDTAYADMAIAAALQSAPGVTDGSVLPGEVALVYDWCHSQLTDGQRATLRAALSAWATQHTAEPPADDVPGWGNYWPRFGYEYVLVGLATFGEDPSALGWLNEYRYRRYRDHDQPALERIAAGGGWPEGTVYDAIANLSRIEALEAWRTATGEDLFESTTWFRDRLGFLLLNNQPGLLADDFFYQYHPYNSTGDAERFRGAMVGYERLMALVLTQRYSGLPLARQLQAYLAASSSDEVASHFPASEFLWFDPAVDTDPPARLTHYAEGTGTLLARSGWPRGAVDDDPRVTHLTFQCGDHFSYHQHFDQNAFTLFKGGDLVVDSGVYSGDGQSSHDINYYVRTIAHNTLVVYNPEEDFSAARPGASSNDGGQRTYAPASRAPSSVEEWDAGSLQHDTCDMLRVGDNSRYTYARGDATKAYNNPTYNQAMDTDLTGNQAKVSRFQREIVYLRPGAGAPREYVVLFDRVGVTRPDFSGANTKLLFHFLQEPDVNGAGTPGPDGDTLYVGAPPAVAESGEGKVFLQFLAPSARNLRKVGGRGQRAFWVFGDNYDWHWSDDEEQPRPTTNFDTEPYGEWRLELEPGDNALEHGFLTVLHPATTETLQMPPTHLVEGQHLTGAHIADSALNRVVAFSSAPDGAAPEGTLVYRFRPTARSFHLIANLTPQARYTLVARAARTGEVTVRLVPDAQGTRVVGPQGVLSFELDAMAHRGLAERLPSESPPVP